MGPGVEAVPRAQTMWTMWTEIVMGDNRLIRTLAYLSHVTMSLLELPTAQADLPVQYHRQLRETGTN